MVILAPVKLYSGRDTHLLVAWHALTRRADQGVNHNEQRWSD